MSKLIKFDYSQFTDRSFYPVIWIDALGLKFCHDCAEKEIKHIVSYDPLYVSTICDGCQEEIISQQYINCEDCKTIIPKEEACESEFDFGHCTYKCRSCTRHAYKDTQQLIGESHD